MPASAKEMAHIDFDEAKRERLREAHQQAIKASKREFIFDQHWLDTRYAGYLLEYLDRKMTPRRKQ